MGRGRAPCCAKVGLNRGAWTPEEDLRLIAYIQKHGHSNWRALPKQAGLLRCGKSCRLRWINYLRPGIKRGNFTQEEEETIIQLHALFGNKWSKIASFLPGRTDNEIKNVWNTHLKKRLVPKEKHNTENPVEVAAESSSSTRSNSSSDQAGETKNEDENSNLIVDSPSVPFEKIEIPAELNIDMLDMLVDANPPYVTNTDMPVMTSPCSSSSINSDAISCNMRREARKELDQVPLEINDITIDVEFLSMIDQGGDTRSPSAEAGHVDDTVVKENTRLLEEEPKEGEVRSWLEYLEQELMGDGIEKMDLLCEMEGSPVSSYFEKRPSSPTHFDLPDSKVVS